MKNSVKRKGFTLVELLIVIVVIGILSAMMMMSSTEAVTSARASNVVSNLRNLKTAALALYTDSMDHFYDATHEPTIAQVQGYLNSGTNVSDGNSYDIEVSASTNTETAGSWFLKCQIKGTTDELNRIKAKLKGRASSTGLLNSAASKTVVYDGSGTTIYMHVR